MIDDLRPATEYEFAVKIVRGRRQSPWSLGIILHKMSMSINTIFGHKCLRKNLSQLFDLANLVLRDLNSYFFGCRYVSHLWYLSKISKMNILLKILYASYKTTIDSNRL